MNHWSDIFPLIFFPLKIIVLVVCGHLAIKWHFDQEKKLKNKTDKESSNENIGKKES